MKHLLKEKPKFVLWIALGSLILGGVSNAAGVFNTPSTGYTLCIDSKTKVVTFPGTEKCKSGQKRLVLGAQGLKGDIGPIGVTGEAGKDGAVGQTGPVGPVGPAGLTGPVGPVGPAGLNGKDGAVGQTGPVGPVGPAALNGKDGVDGKIGATGPSFIWLTPSDLVTSALSNAFPNITLAQIFAGGYDQYVVKIADNNGSSNQLGTQVSLPTQWLNSQNVYATVYWAAEKSDGNIKAEIGYSGGRVGELPPPVGYINECEMPAQIKPMVMQSCTTRLSVTSAHEISWIAVNRYAYVYPGLSNPDTNTGDLYIYGIKLELRS